MGFNDEMPQGDTQRAARSRVAPGVRLNNAQGLSRTNSDLVAGAYRIRRSILHCGAIRMEQWHLLSLESPLTRAALTATK